MAGKSLSDLEKACILAFLEENVLQSEIARRTGRSLRTISSLQTAAKYLPSGDVPKKKPVSGKLKETSKWTAKLIRRDVLTIPCVTAPELKQIHPHLTDNVSDRTIQEWVQKNLKLPAHAAAKKPLPINLMRQKRLEFARKYKDMAVEEWIKVMWSDESTFQWGGELQGCV